MYIITSVSLMLAGLRKKNVLSSAESWIRITAMFSTLSCRNSRLLRHCFSQKSKPLLRSIKLPGIVSKSVLLNKTNYRLVYHFPYITFVSAFLKTNIKVPLVCVPLSPLLYFLDGNKISAFIMLVSAGILYVFGRLSSKVAKNIVGKMYVNKDGYITNVMISSVDASGRRIDRIHPLNDIINCDCPPTIARFMGFTELSIENSDVYYYVNLNSCKIIDEMAFDWILGARFGPVDPNEAKEVNEVEPPKKQLQSK